MSRPLQTHLEEFAALWRAWTGAPGFAWQTRTPQDVPDAVAQAAQQTGETSVQLGAETWWVARQDGEAPLALACQVRDERDLQLFRFSFRLLADLAEEQTVNQQLTDELINAWDRLHFVFELAQSASRFTEIGPQMEEMIRTVHEVFPAKETFLVLWREGDVQVFSTASPPHPVLARFPEETWPGEQLLICRREEAGNLLPVLRSTTATWRNFVLVQMHVAGFQGLLGLRDYPDPNLTAADRSLLLSVAEQLSALLEASFSRLEHLRNRHLRRELNIARQIQLSMLPRSLPEVPGMEFASLIQPAYTVGGDFYDVVSTRDRILILVGDVAGKGVPAAMLTALMHAIFKSEAQQDVPVKDILQSIHRQVYPDLDRAETFITAALVAVEPERRRFTYASAGHTTSLLFRAETRQVIDLPSTGVPFGVLPQAEFDMTEASLAPGDELLLYSDGVTEVENTNGAVFGKQGLIDVLMAVFPAAAEEQVAAIRRAVDIHRSVETLRDDLVMLLVRALPERSDAIRIVPFVYPVELRTARALTQFIRQQAEVMCFATPKQRQTFLDELELAVSEIVTNVVTHAFPPGRTGRVQGRVTVYPERVVVDLIDNGEPFEAIALQSVRAVDEPSTRGYGMHIARQLLQICQYRRLKGQRNHWLLEKRVDGGGIHAN